MNAIETLKTNPLIINGYRWLKRGSNKLKKFRRESWKKAKYTFDDRSRGQSKLCILLGGYKPFLYPVTLERVRRFLDDDIDMCVVTSGLYSQEIDKCCRDNGWSYIHTKVNNVSLVQNLAIWLHPNAKYIYKMDEDIFVTKNSFKKMYETLLDCKENGEYEPLFVAPLLPVNGYCYLRVLKKLDLVEEYSSRFERPIYSGCNRMIEKSPETSKFFWGGGTYSAVPHIDVMNARFQAEELNYTACPSRFSIGFILFERKIWDDMDGFEVNLWSTAMGKDEVALCSIAMKKSKAIIVSENCLCGHLSFGTQNAEMKKYYLEHPEIFEIRDV